MAIDFMQFTQEDRAKFEPLFKAPVLVDIAENLTWQQFERFLGYLFFCAGFEVENVSNDKLPRGPGVDLNVYVTRAEETPIARIEARRYTPNGSGIQLDDVVKFAGVITLAGDVPGYLITTAKFAVGAHHVISRPKAKDIHLVDGDALLRYITYVYGSRVADGYGFHRATLPIWPDWLFANVSQEPRNSAHILTIANNKGGVSKSTTALNVGIALAGMGKRILLIDLDGQANLTSTLLTRGGALMPPSEERFITEYFSAVRTPLRSLVMDTRFDNIWLIAGHEELNRMDLGGAGRPEQELAFARAVRDPELRAPSPAASDFDWIILDTPPAQAHAARSAIAAADFVLIPLVADSFTVAGINRALTAAKTMQALTNVPQARGLVLTQWRSSAPSMRDIAATLRVEAPLLGYPLFETHVPYDDHIEQAHMSLIEGGNDILFNWKASGAAKAY